MTIAINDLLREGVIAHQAGNLAEAARLYLAALELDADNASAHNNLGFVLAQQQQWSESLVHLRTALRLNPNMSMAHCNLGQVLVNTGQPTEGLTHLEQATACDPDNITAWDNLARIRVLLGDFQGGEYAAIRALKLQPNAPHLHTRLGIAVAAQQRLAEAVQHYRQALALDGNHQEAWAQLGITCFLRNDLGSAREALATALRLNQEDHNALRHLALVNLSLGNRDVAIAQFEHLLELNPSDEASRLDLAVILLSAHQPAAALENLDSISGEVRASSKFRFYLGLALQQSGEQEAGVKLLRQLADLPDDEYGVKARQMLLVS